MYTISELQKEIRLQYALLESHCIQTEVGVEAIDPRLFINHLRKLVDSSAKVLGILTKDTTELRIDFIAASDLVLHREVVKRPFLLAGANMGYCPAGFKGFVSDFLKLVLANKTDLLNTSNALLDANGLFAGYIKEPTRLAKVDVEMLPSLPQVKSIAKDVSEFFKGKEGVDEARIEDLYKSWEDFKDCANVIQKTTKELHGIDLKDISGAADDLYDMIDRLIDKVDQGSITISKPMAKGLGKLVLDLADWLAIFSLMVTKFIATNKAHTDTIKIINNLTK